MVIGETNPHGFEALSDIFVDAHGYMYFQGTDHKLWRSKTDGTDVSNPNGFTTLSSIHVDASGYMYFRGTDDTLWRSTVDGAHASNPNRFKTLSSIFVDAHDYMYFRGTDDRLWRSKTDGTDVSNPNGFRTVSNIFVDAGGYMHFRGTDDRLWRSKTDGTDVSNPHGFTTGSDVFVDGAGYMYFQGTDNTLWRSKTDGTDISNPHGFKTQSSVYVDGRGYMYFRGMDEKLWRWAWNGPGPGADDSNPNGFTTLSDIFVDAHGYMYFRGTDDTLWRSRTDGTDISNPNGFRTASSVFVDAHGHMYFRGTDDTLWRSKTDGTDVSNPNGFKTLSAVFVDAQDYMYFRGTDDRLWRSRTDGTDVSNPNGFRTVSNIFVDANGYMYFRGTDNKVWVSTTDGQQAVNPNRLETSSDVFVADYYMYFRGTDGTLWSALKAELAHNDFPGSDDWRNPGGHRTSSNVVLDPEGHMYFRGSDDRVLRARTDGSDLSNPNGFTTQSNVSLDNAGYIYFRGMDDKLWRSKIREHSTASSVSVDRDGSMYFVGTDRQVRKYDFRDGKLIDFTAAAIVQLQRWYEWSRGQWRDDWVGQRSLNEWEVRGWWHSANALNALIDFMRITHTRAYQDVLENTFDKVMSLRATGFINDFYDDEGWWALALINGFDLTANARYLDAAKLICEDIAAGWHNSAEGGIWWGKWWRYRPERKELKVKNAIENELFIAVAARLYSRTHTQKYLDWAVRVWKWFENANLIDDNQLVKDSAGSDAPWTYLQGVIIGAGCDMYAITGDVKYRSFAQATVNAVLSTTLVRPDGILTEFVGEDDPEHYYQDGYQFKGIFMRNLAHLHETAGDPKYRHLIEVNARGVLNSRNGFNQYGKSWYAKPYKDDHPDFARQTSAIECLNAALKVLGPAWVP